MSRRGELDRQPDGLDHGKNLSSRLSTLPSLSSDYGGDKRGKYCKRYRLQCKEEGMGA